MMLLIRSRAHAPRRGIALVVAVIMLSVVALVTLGALASAADDARVGSLRIESLRAFYAAESGAMLSRRQQRENASAPLTGTFSLPEGQRFTVIAPFKAAPLEAGVSTIDGLCGRAATRAEVESE